VGLSPTGKRRLRTAHASCGHVWTAGARQVAMNFSSAKTARGSRYAPERIYKLRRI
jgi:hypothetical protein